MSGPEGHDETTPIEPYKAKVAHPLAAIRGEHDDVGTRPDRCVPNAR